MVSPKFVWSVSQTSIENHLWRIPQSAQKTPLRFNFTSIHMHQHCSLIFLLDITILITLSDSRTWEVCEDFFIDVACFCFFVSNLLWFATISIHFSHNWTQTIESAQRCLQASVGETGSTAGNWITQSTLFKKRQYIGRYTLPFYYLTIWYHFILEYSY